MNADTSDFLAALLFTMPEDHASHKNGWMMHEFHPDFQAAVKRFCDGFRAHLSDLRDKCETEELAELLDGDAPTRDFGCNVYFSLSGHGVGFWDDRDRERGEALQAALVEFAGGDRYRFEQIDLMKFSGKIHFPLRSAAFRKAELAKVFAVPATV